MTGAEERLAELGLELPPVPAPLAAYVPAVRTGGLVYTAGQLPMVDGQLTVKGRVGTEVSVEEAAAGARVAALNAVAAAAAEAGGLREIARVVKAVVFVAASPGFTEHAAVANGASELLGSVFGDLGRHARSTVGVASLPLDAAVEVELVVQTAARARVVPV